MPGPGCGPGRETKESMTMLKIYGTKTSSNVQKVLWCCGELGLPFERDENTGGPSRNDRTAAYMALNPNGLIPTIDEDGFILWESNVVVRYLSAKYDMGMAFRALLRKPAEATPEEQVRAALHRAGKAWKILDTHLATRSFVGGASLTMGDIALGNAIHRWFKLPVERPDLPHLKSWYGRF